MGLYGAVASHSIQAAQDCRPVPCKRHCPAFPSQLRHRAAPSPGGPEPQAARF